MSSSQMETMLGDIDQSIIDNYHQRTLEMTGENEDLGIALNELSSVKQHVQYTQGSTIMFVHISKYPMIVVRRRNELLTYFLIWI
ncbi:hypothetical protein BELL_0322g00020 [Botrytis elliptica]|uniref:Uncharacterized protein n=1 Tax=Botrytis elliptica TaxID=278938 RepID=A0A4Z1JK04_9HELO|nr:hypothetical protein BELL_0322g00020 [Botrytis elliptica]